VRIGYRHGGEERVEERAGDICGARFEHLESLAPATVPWRLLD